MIVKKSYLRIEGKGFRMEVNLNYFKLRYNLNE